jgi:hypothetical protein
LGEAIVAGCDPAESLDPSVHALDGIAVAIEDGREAGLPAPIGLGWNVRRGTLALNFATDGVAVVALVAIEDVGRGHLVEQCVGGDAVRHLAAGQEERNRTAEMVGEGVDFRGPPAARTTDRLSDLPPFPPAALR